MVDMNLSKSQKKNLGYLERGWPSYLYSRKAIPVANEKQGPFCGSWWSYNTTQVKSIYFNTLAWPTTLLYILSHWILFSFSHSFTLALGGYKERKKKGTWTRVRVRIWIKKVSWIGVRVNMRVKWGYEDESLLIIWFFCIVFHSNAFLHKHFITEPQTHRPIVNYIVELQYLMY